MHNTSREHRISELEAVLVETERQLIELHQSADVDRPPSDLPPPAPTPPPPTRPVPPPPGPARSAPPPPSPPPPVSPTPDTPEESPLWAGLGGAEWWLRISGITMVVASAIFFVSTAIRRGWIGPTAQLTLATAISLLLIGASFRFPETRRPWRITLAVGGAASLFASGVVGFVGLDLLSYPVAVGWLVGSVAVFMALARAHSSQSLHFAASPAAAVGILLLGIEDRFDPVVMSVLGLGYLFISVMVAQGQRWSLSRSVGAVFGAIVASTGLALALLDDVAAGSVLLIAGGAVVVGLCTAASHGIDFRQFERADLDDTSPVALATLAEARVMALIVPWLSVIVGVVVDDVTTSTSVSLAVLVTSISLGLMVIVASRVLPLTMQLLHGAAAVTTATVAIVALVDGPTLLAALLGQTVIAGLLALRFRSVEMTAVAVVLGSVVTAMTTRLVLQGTFVMGLTVAESAVVLGVLFVVSVIARLLRENEIFSMAWVAPWLLALGWASATFRDVPQGQMIVTLIWAGLGAVFVLVGARLPDRGVVVAGLLTLFVTAGKLVFIDLVSVDVLWRAGLFFVVGAVFLRLAFVLPALLASTSEPDQPAIDSLDDDSAEVGVG